MQIPGGLQYWSPELRWKAPKGLSLRQIAAALVAARLGNPAMTAARGWSVDLETVVAEVDAYNANICVQYGWKDYVIFDNSPMPSFPQASGPSGPLARGVKNVVAGSETILDMFGADGPVDKATANARAAVCAACPLNDKVSAWTDYFTVPAAAFIRKALGIIKDLDLKTEKDAELNLCKACDCPLKTKVWARLEHIEAHIPAESKARLHPKCWILNEA